MSYQKFTVVIYNIFEQINLILFCRQRLALERFSKLETLMI